MSRVPPSMPLRPAVFGCGCLFPGRPLSGRIEHMFEISVDEVAGVDITALATTLLSLSDQDLLFCDIEAAQAVVAATQRVLSAVSAVQLLGIEAWSRRSGEQIAAD